MKKTFLTLALAALGFTSYAQTEKTEKGIISLSYMLSSPSGDYGDNDADNEDAHFAAGGSMIGLDYSYFFNERYGAGVSFGSIGHSFDSEAFEKALKDAGATDIKITSDPSGSVYAMLHFVGKQALTSKLYCYGKIGVGVASSINPARTLEFSGVRFEQDQVSASAFAYSFAPGLRYQFGKFGLGLEAMAFNTKPKFEYEDDDVEVKMNSLNVGLTLNYVFK